MTGRDLTSDPAAEHLAASEPGDAALRADALAGGLPELAPRSLTAAELEPDDEDVASLADWDDPEVL